MIEVEDGAVRVRVDGAGSQDDAIEAAAAIRKTLAPGETMGYIAVELFRDRDGWHLAKATLSIPGIKGGIPGHTAGTEALSEPIADKVKPILQAAGFRFAM